MVAGGGACKGSSGDGEEARARADSAKENPPSLPLYRPLPPLYPPPLPPPPPLEPMETDEVRVGVGAGGVNGCSVVEPEVVAAPLVEEEEAAVKRLGKDSKKAENPPLPPLVLVEAVALASTTSS